MIINTWHGAWLNYPACLIKGTSYCNSPTSCCPSLFLTFLFLSNIITFSVFFLFVCFICSSLGFLSSLSKFSSFFPLTSLSPLPSNPLPSQLISLSVRPLPPFCHSAVFTVIHYHFFCQLALTVLSFVKRRWGGPLGDEEMTEGGLYLPLWPLPCHLLNHVANRQHCLPARPHQDNREPHSYLIQWSV